LSSYITFLHKINKIKLDNDGDDFYSISATVLSQFDNFVSDIM